MKKLFYYTFWNFENAKSNGICKKINSQIKFFENHGYQVDYSYLLGEDYYIHTGDREILLQKKHKIWTKPFAERQLTNYIAQKKYDCAYMRYACSEWEFFRLAKTLRDHGTKILLEIPTYPYEGELSDSLIDRIYLGIDRAFRGRAALCVNRITTYSKHEEIFGKKTIKLMNGVDLQNIRKKEPSRDDGRIDLVCVAVYSEWHALERILKGMADYRSKASEKDIYLHVIGDGPVLQKYKDLVREKGLEPYVIFYGNKTNEEMDDIFNQSDIAIEVLGGHRKGIKYSSSLKSREYLGRGIPFISEMPNDVIPTDWKYYIKIPYDESPVDMGRIVSFYDEELSTKDKRQQAIDDIRQYAERTVDMNITMLPTLKYFEGKNKKISVFPDG